MNCFAALDHEADFIAYLSRRDAFHEVPDRFQKNVSRSTRMSA